MLPLIVVLPVTRFLALIYVFAPMALGWAPARQAREVFKLAVKDAGAVLLEPIYKYTITVPEEYMGDVLGDLNTRRARVQRSR